MAQPARESKSDALRLDFDRRLMLSFCGAVGALWWRRDGRLGHGKRKRAAAENRRVPHWRSKLVKLGLPPALAPIAGGAKPTENLRKLATAHQFRRPPSVGTPFAMGAKG